jgi:hypothetical protein
MSIHERMCDMRKYLVPIITIALLLNIIACGSTSHSGSKQNNTVGIIGSSSSPEASSYAVEPPVKTDNNSPSVAATASSDLAEKHPVYIDESQYTGDKLEIIKLINLEMKYLYEEDKKAYLSLLLPNSGIYPADVSTFRLPGNKIQHVELQYDPVVKEQKSVFEAQVDLYEYTNDKDKRLATYVFQKGKGPEDTWKFSLID